MAFQADLEATAARVTDAPSVGPTMPPTFNLQEFALDSSFKRGLILSPESVLDVVPDLSWSSANLDEIELNIIRHIDGISPLSLLQTMLGIPQDELHVMLAMLLARQLVSVVQPVDSGVWKEPSSGVFECVPAQDVEDDETLAQTG